MLRMSVLLVSMIFVTAACGEDTAPPPKGIEDAIKVLEKALGESKDTDEQLKLKDAIAALKKVASTRTIYNDVLADFMDHTDKYKGRVLSFRAIYGASFPKGKTLGLHQQGGNTGVPFLVKDPTGGVKLNLEFDIPKDFKLPVAPAGVSVILTFKCKEGKTDTGNELIEIVRP